MLNQVVVVEHHFLYEKIIRANMKIATFNINSVRARIENLCDWLNTEQPDIVLLQELKCQDEQFPHEKLKSIGYEASVYGQKAYNGVAVLSKHKIEKVVKGLPGDDSDEQSRYMECTIKGINVCNLYLPNGNPIGKEKYEYKLKWMDRLGKHIKNKLLNSAKPLLIGGDWNVIPTDDDCLDPDDWVDDAAASNQVRARFKAYQNLGLYDAFNALNPNKKQAFTFWDYQRGAWSKNNGIRIDFFLLNGNALDKTTNCWVDKKPRGKEKASDHTPLLIALK